MAKKINDQEERLKTVEGLTPWIRAISYILIGLSLPAIMWVLSLLYQVLTHKTVLP